MYYTVIKHDGHLRTRGKCRKHEPQASVLYISRVFDQSERAGFNLYYKMFCLFFCLWDISELIKTSARKIEDCFNLILNAIIKLDEQ